MRKGVSLLIHGAAKGADTLAENWARSRQVNYHGVPAKWDQHGNSAGPIRNEEMLALGPEGCVAFPGGTGTADMVERCEKAGVKVWKPRREEDGNPKNAKEEDHGE